MIAQQKEKKLPNPQLQVLNINGLKLSSLELATVVKTGFTAANCDRHNRNYGFSLDKLQLVSRKRTN